MNEMEYVYEVYKAGSFSNAARNLYISQPALSTAVSRVEKKIGNKIFNRSTTPLTLTEAGEAYIDAVEKINMIEYDLNNKLLEINDLKCGKLNVGGANFFSSCMLPPIIKIFAEQYPGVSLQITESDSIRLYEDIKTKNVDLILDGGTCPKEQFIAHTLFSEHILLGIPSSNPINDRYLDYQLSYEDICADKIELFKPCIPINELAKERFILLTQGHDLYARSMSIFEHNDIHPENMLYLNQLMTAYNLAKQGIGLAFVTDTLIRLTARNDSLKYYKIDDASAKRDIFLAHRANLSPTKAMKKFIEIAKNIYS